MSATSKVADSRDRLTIPELRRMNFEQLSDVYRSAKPPGSLSDLNGDARGAMLAWRSPATGPLARLLEAMGASPKFPWEGKTFQSEHSDKGAGINRINLFTKMKWFPFSTRFDKSFLDGKPSFVLDYSGQGNPPLIAQIVDEVREVGPGVYMGPAAIKMSGKPRPVLFFAVYFP
ncbi:MAG TPA: hypothetical protein VJU86_13340 [Pyrinomonadaceae bacterium]|nr:hypothetical protein [Pyrinomonadaceae bacterium]